MTLGKTIAPLIYTPFGGLQSSGLNELIDTMLYPSVWGKIWRRLRDWRETAIARPFESSFANTRPLNFWARNHTGNKGVMTIVMVLLRLDIACPTSTGESTDNQGVSIILLCCSKIANSRPFQIGSPVKRRNHNSPPPQNHAMKRSFCSWIARFAPFSGEWIHGGEMSVFLIVPLDPEKNSATKRAIFSASGKNCKLSTI